jgi:Protein of unknown function (DUF3429)
MKAADPACPSFRRRPMPWVRETFEMTIHHGRRRIEIVESGDIPRLDVLFGFGPTVPFVIGVVVALWFPEPWRLTALQLTVLWGSAIMLFLSGVRRGLSFRTEDGPTWSQIATMLALFCLGLSSLAALWRDQVIWALVILLAGFSMIFVLDPIAARRGEAPLYFERLRRLQMPIVVLALVVSTFIAVRA